MKKLLALILASAMALSMVACSSQPAPAPSSEAEPEVVTPAAPELLMATTTSTDNTGLLDYLKPNFEDATG